MKLENKQQNKLIAIAISHYCEKVRWAMDYLDIEYTEENHAPPSHRQYTARHGGTTVPVLVTEQQAFTDSHEILQYLDSISPNKKLYPADPQLCEGVKALEKLFDEKLGVATRIWGYYYAIQKPLKVAIAWGIKAPLRERIKTIFAVPKIPQVLKTFYNITPETKDTALEDVKEVFAVVNQELDSEREYLVGDRLSAADITFAALASPILRPHHHPIYSSDLAQVSAERALVMEELRSTPAGRFVQRMYQEHRH